MPNQKEYRIVINGISESIGAIDSLIAKINTLEEKITALNKSGITVNVQQTGTVNTGSQTQQAQQVAEVQKQITIEIDRQNEALRQQASFIDASKAASNDVLQIANAVLGTYGENIAKLDELNQQLAANKQAQKEVADALKNEAIDAQTAAESRQRLLDEELRIKQARSEVSTILKNEVKMTQAQEASYDQMSQTLGRLRDALRASGSGLSPEQFEAVSRAIDKMDKELKEADKSVGNFQRNVGNYASAADGFGKITVTIAGVNKEFESARSAIMEVRNAMAQLVASGQQGTEAYKALEEQMKNLQLAMITVNDSIDRAKDASAGLHDAVEAIQGLAAIGSIGQGFASLFGIDDSALGEQIKKLTSLMAIMQGLQQLSTQMATGTGIGPALKKVLDVSGINNDWQQLKESLTVIGQRLGIVKTQAEGAAVGMGALAASAKVAEAAVKGIGRALLIGFLIEGVVWTIELLVDGFKALYNVCHDWLSMEDDMARANKGLQTQFDEVSQSVEQQVQAIEELEGKGAISTYDALEQKQSVYNNALKDTTNKLKEVIDLQTKAGAIKPALADWSKLNEKVDELNKLQLQGKDISEEYNVLMSTVVNDVAARIQNLDMTDRKAIEEFNKWLTTAPLVQTAMQHFANSGVAGARAVGEALQSTDGTARNLLATMMQISGQMDKTLRDQKRLAEYIRKYGKNAQAYLNRDREVEGFDQRLSEQDRATLTADADRKLKEQLDSQNRKYTSANKKRINDARKTAQDLIQMEKNIQSDKIAAMRDGLTKTLALIEQERKERLEAIKQYPASKQEEARNAANARYDKEALDAQKKYHNDYIKETLEFYSKVDQIVAESEGARVSRLSDELSRSMKEERRLFDKVMASWDNLTLGNNLGMSDKEIAKLKETFGIMRGLANTEDIVNRKYMQAREDLRTFINSLENGADLTEEQTEEYNRLLENMRGYYKYLQGMDETRMNLIEQTKDLRLDRLFNFDNSAVRETMEQYYWYMASLAEKNDEFLVEQQKSALESKLKADLAELSASSVTALDEFDKLWEGRLKDKKFIESEFKPTENMTAMEAAIKERNKRRIELEGKFQQQFDRLTRDHQNSIANIDEEALERSEKRYENYYTNVTRLLTDANSSIMNNLSGLPDKLKNAWGTFNLGDYKNKLREADKDMTGLQESVKLKLESLREDFLKGFIDQETFYRIQRELLSVKQTVEDNLVEISDMSSAAAGEWWKGIDEWIQQVASSFQQVLSAIFDFQNGEFDRLQEAIDKELDAVQKKYDEMEELAQKHKDAMNEIENELSTARGDRRAHLIDALSAEIQAQRDALAAQRKAEKEKEALEKKSDKLELQRKKQQRKQDIIQAILNGALAISQAATNKWPVPAIPLMALAGAATAAQVAIMSATHYRDGGLLKGRSHEQGGIYMGGGVEAEGDEFIINKRTTTKNLPLIEYINSKKRKLDIGDFIEFYNGKGQRSRQPIIQNKFAEGGLLPNIDLAERLVNVVIDRDTRPIYVSVVDINRAQQRVAQVEQLAGLQ